MINSIRSFKSFKILSVISLLLASTVPSIAAAGECKTVWICVTLTLPLGAQVKVCVKTEQCEASFGSLGMNNSPSIDGN
jgi:hypothetical protein